jgi:acetyl esterase/lipase
VLIGAMIGGVAVVSLLLGRQTVGLAVFNAMAPRVVRVPDIAFGEGARRKMDLYAPREKVTGPALPLIVFWYGGAWQTGDRDDYRFVGAALAARGAVTVLPDYRLYPEVRFPDFLRDAAAAVARAQAEAVRYGADPRRTVLAGHSAGAYIAAMLAVQPAYLREAGVDPQTIAGFVGLSGPYAIEPNTDALHTIFDSVAKSQDYQVVRQVMDSALPPALLVHGTADDTVRVSHTEKMFAALQAAQVTVERRLIPDRKHVDTVAALSRPGGFRIPDLLQQVSDFAAQAQPR